MTDIEELLGWIGQAEAIVTDPRRQDDLPALSHAVELLRRVDAGLPPEYDDLRPDLAGLYGGALISLFELTPQRALIDEAIRVLSGTTDPLWWTNLGLALRMRYRHYGDLDDLSRAATATRQTVAFAAERTPFERAALLSNHGIIMQELFVAQPRRTELLEEAVSTLRSAVEAAPEHPELYRWVGALANTFVIAFEVTGSLHHLDAAIEQLRPIEPSALPAVFRPAHLSNLGTALGYRFIRTGNRDDLDEALGLFREAVRQAAGTPDPAGHHANLGQALLLRFRLFGGTSDVDEAIDVCRTAVAVAAPGHTEWATWQAALGGALTARFERLGHLADLDAAIDAFRQAVAVTPAGRLDRGGWLSNLGAALTLRFTVGRDPRDGAEAVRRATEAVAATEPHDPTRSRHLFHLSRALQAQTGATGRLATADEAVTAARAATDPQPADPALAVSCLRGLGDALVQRHGLNGDQADRAGAAEVYRRAATVAGAPNLNRAICAQAAGHLFGRIDWPTALDCLATAIQLVGSLAGRTVTRSDRERFLARFTGTATDAAAAAIEIGTLARGITVLEQGRAVLLAQTMETGHDLDALRGRHPHLAERLTQLGRLLNHDDTE